VSSRPKILIVGNSREEGRELVDRLNGSCELIVVPSILRALSRMKRDHLAGVYVSSEHLQEAFQVGKLLQNERILEGLPDGVLLLDADNVILWSNRRLAEWNGRESVVGEKFYSVFDGVEIMGPDYCPLQTALATATPSTSTLRSGEHYFQVLATPVLEAEGPPHNLLVTVRDVTQETLQQQKLAAIHQAGIELADLKPEELLQMPVAERIDLLKANILHYTKDLLHFDVVEIRLLDTKTGRLEPLLAVGFEPAATTRDLYARPKGNGVTGFVAATGKSYLCEDTAQDPMYLEGSKGAKSSLTVPLILHDEVIGTFNVESPEACAFSENDLQFLEIFSRDVAAAINTFELLVAEKASSTAASVEAIHSAVALPVDEILNEAVNIMERYIGHEPEVTDRLQRILRNARDIKQVIQKVGQKMAPSQALPQPPDQEERPLLKGRKVLVVDADESVRSAAHDLLERYGCVVETAHNGAEAIFMACNVDLSENYDVMIADIRLPDMSGYDLMVKLNATEEPVPLVLMTGFGYDPGHSIVKARRAGLQAVLYKPFRLDQLLSTVEQVVQKSPVRNA